MYLSQHQELSVVLVQKNAGALVNNEDPLPQVPNRFSFVIERIERLHKVSHISNFWCRVVWFLRRAGDNCSKVKYC